MLNKSLNSHSEKIVNYQTCETERDKEPELSKLQSSDKQDPKEENNRYQVLEDLENVKNQAQNIHSHTTEELDVLKLQDSGNELIWLEKETNGPMKQKAEKVLGYKSHVLDDLEYVNVQTQNQEKVESEHSGSQISDNDFISSGQDSKHGVCELLKQEMLDSKNHDLDHFENAKNQTDEMERADNSEPLKLQSSDSESIFSEQDLKDAINGPVKQEKLDEGNNVFDYLKNVKNKSLNLVGDEELEQDKKAAAKQELTSRSYIWDYVSKVKNHTLHPWTTRESELLKWLSSGRDYISSKQDIMLVSKETDQGKVDAAERVSTERSFVWNYVTKVRNQTLYPWKPEESEPSRDQPLDLPNSGTELTMPGKNSKSGGETGQDQKEALERVSSSKNNVWEYVAKVRYQTLYPWRSDENEIPQSNGKQDISGPIGQEENEKLMDMTASKRNLWHYLTKVKNQTLYLWRAEEAEISRDQSTELQDSDKHSSPDLSRCQVFDYFTGKLSDAYKDAERRLQGTRDFIRNVGVDEIRYAVSQYMTMMSKDLPQIQQIKFQLPPKPHPVLENKVSLVDLSSACALGGSQGFGLNATLAWPKRSVSSVRIGGTEDSHPEEFYQGLIEFPPALEQLRSLSSQQILEKTESLSSQRPVKKILSTFWLRAASFEQPSPKPACLLLSEQGLTVVSADKDSLDTLNIFHHFDLTEIREVQISLAGQHVRLIGFSEDSVLAVFTHNQELTQDFCKAVLKTCCPETFSKVTETHPLLSEDLMALSLDWTSSVPDVTLHSGLNVTSRFKRVLADLLYIIHGNMDDPNKPSLAHICPLLYTSVRVTSSIRVHQDSLFQFLLTDTHVALLQEDGVFHPVPRGSSQVLVQPQFQGLKLRRRSDIRCLLVRRNENCFSVDVVFTKRNKQALKWKVELRRGSADVPASSSLCDSWKLTFGCSSEAQMLINHLCI
ncbi:hypothetical protein GOODEAATRI_009515 [Goodea atripinnis]|uniref:Uncharacterized protein n=1 Tax=Goodea atripinnis TaxID=208336 RepID=A0ABV0N010_9TELE